MSANTQCWMCASDLSKGTLKTKRKKIHGESAKRTVKVLETICLEYLGSDLMATTFKTADYLCHKCVAKIDNIDVQKRDVFRREKEVASWMEGQMTSDEISIGSKRPRCDDSEHGEMQSMPTADQSSTPKHSTKGRPSSVSVRIFKKLFHSFCVV